jgi:hypothetical protein
MVVPLVGVGPFSSRIGLLGLVLVCVCIGTAAVAVSFLLWLKHAWSIAPAYAIGLTTLLVIPCVLVYYLPFPPCAYLAIAHTSAGCEMIYGLSSDEMSEYLGLGSSGSPGESAPGSLGAPGGEGHSVDTK